MYVHMNAGRTTILYFIPKQINYGKHHCAKKLKFAEPRSSRERTMSFGIVVEVCLHRGEMESVSFIYFH